ncbi:MAG: hypothetical protein JXR31_03800, partial [Prolixibacteraceae bacterium]|nr:hypothetical protein [Prolixibacteraceae bacterium]
PVGEKLGIGVEIENARLKGSNDDPAYYNYFVTTYSPIANYEHEALIYTTGVTNLLGTARFYPIGHNTFTPFVKLQAGFAMIGTELQFKSPEDQTNKPDPLYSRGTDSSLGDNASKYTTAHFGGGIGFEYLLTSSVSVYGDLTFSYIDADILDGVPDFTYDETLGYSVLAESATIINKISIGLTYTFGSAPGSGGGGSKKGGVPGKSGSTSTHLPFYRKK